jgi:uncharacterized membrane protein
MFVRPISLVGSLAAIATAIVIPVVTAVVSFQKGTGLQDNGEVGPLTWTQLGSARD